MSTGEKKRPINRLKSMYPLRALMDKNYQAAQEAQKEGRLVAWCMQESYASPFLNAIGIDSVYPENYGTVCAATGAAEKFLERSEAEGFPTHLCGYAQNCLGYVARMTELDWEIPPGLPQGGMPKPILLVGSGMGCDARFKWFQALSKYMEVPLWVIEFPTAYGKENLMEGAHERSIRFLVKELKAFAAFLERLTGRKMDWAKLREDIDNTMAMDAVWYEINELRMARPGPMHARDFWSSMSASLFRTTDPKGVTMLYKDMLEEVKYRVDHGISAINTDEKYRMIFVGLPPWHALKFFDTLAERGWNFVTEVAYHPPRPIDLTGVDDPVERLVRYRHQGMDHLIDVNFGPDEAEKIKEEMRTTDAAPRLSLKPIQDFRIDGGFLHPLLTCRTATASLNLMERGMMSHFKVPGISIEGDIVDTRLFDPEDALRKAEAFEETMDHYKAVRKEAGFDW
ncbi:MAG: 2-hydroxyacyl-CoA dehydratase family protein [Desulfobacterales bacterium]